MIYFLSFVLFPNSAGTRVISLVTIVVLVFMICLPSSPASLGDPSHSFLCENFALIFLWLRKPLSWTRTILEHMFPLLHWMKSHCGRILPFCIFCMCKTHLEHPRITIYKPIRIEI